MADHQQAMSQWEEESHAAKLARKSKNSPFMIIGLTGLVGVCGYGIYKYRHRGKMSTSVFLMQLRVAAQGSVVAALTVGLAYSLLKEHVFKISKNE